MPARLNDLAVIFISIILQSLPFVLLGLFASALVQRYLSEQAVARWMPRRVFPAVLSAGLFGFVAPVCDCGAIPLGRRLASKGVPPFAALTFMLAAPVVNPIVAVSTFVAFQGSWLTVALRLGMTLIVAIVIGMLASGISPKIQTLARQPRPTAGEGRPGPDSTGGIDVTDDRSLSGLVRHVNIEFFDVMFYVVLGALCTAAVQALFARRELLDFGTSPVGSILALMPLATLLSICSEADAFVARAFAGTFSPGSVLAFMVIGQIVDLRNGLLFVRTTGARVAIFVVLVAYLLVFTQALGVNAAIGSL
jgi:uncharacterized membrane protein YraQ (UPF0718 family)